MSIHAVGTSLSRLVYKVSSLEKEMATAAAEKQALVEELQHAQKMLLVNSLEKEIDCLRVSVGDVKDRTGKNDTWLSELQNKIQSKLVAEEAFVKRIERQQASTRVWIELTVRIFFSLFSKILGENFCCGMGEFDILLHARLHLPYFTCQNQGIPQAMCKCEQDVLGKLKNKIDEMRARERTKEQAVEKLESELKRVREKNDSVERDRKQIRERLADEEEDNKKLVGSVRRGDVLLQKLHGSILEQHKTIDEMRARLKQLQAMSPTVEKGVMTTPVVERSTSTSRPDSLGIAADKMADMRDPDDEGLEAMNDLEAVNSGPQLEYGLSERRTEAVQATDSSKREDGANREGMDILATVEKPCKDGAEQSEPPVEEELKDIVRHPVPFSEEVDEDSHLSDKENDQRWGRAVEAIDGARGRIMAGMRKESGKGHEEGLNDEVAGLPTQNRVRDSNNERRVVENSLRISAKGSGIPRGSDSALFPLMRKRPTVGAAATNGSKIPRFLESIDKRGKEAQRSDSMKQSFGEGGKRKSGSEGRQRESRGGLGGLFSAL
ncbi:hypothetical protein BSKO_10525 [Bryopsis sp. KO-2023]|nr:hypothetical protein BSKO_10525 [Bryopsis sp. KO-2023]